jgi:hypothetical protein
VLVAVESVIILVLRAVTVLVPMVVMEVCIEVCVRFTVRKRVEVTVIRGAEQVEDGLEIVLLCTTGASDRSHAPYAIWHVSVLQYPFPSPQ